MCPKIWLYSSVYECAEEMEAVSRLFSYKELCSGIVANELEFFCTGLVEKVTDRLKGKAGEGVQKLSEQPCSTSTLVATNDSACVQLQGWQDGWRTVTLGNVMARIVVELQEWFGLVAGPEKMGCSHREFHAVFLGHRPYPVGGTNNWAWGPTSGQRLFKHHVYRGDGNPYSWLHGVAQMVVRCYPHVPILFEQATRTCEILKKTKATP